MKNEVKKMKIFEDLCYGQGSLDLYLPDTESYPIYIYFHGGGLTGGTRRFRRSAEYLTEHGVAVASADYRLYPNARYPDFVRDCADAIAFVLKKSEASGHITHTVVGGSSAGGWLSQMLYFNPAFLAPFGGRDMVDGWIFDAGQPTTHFNVLKYDRGFDPRCVLVDEAAPLWYLRENFDPAKAPFIRILSAEHDMVNRREQNVMLYTAMLHFKFPEEKLEMKVYEGYTHCKYCGTEEYLADTLAFIRKVACGGKEQP